MIKYRPHRGSLDEAMAEARTFVTVEEMFAYIIKENPLLFSNANLSISENVGKDNRIDWSETRYVCTDRFGTQFFEKPQAIGFCSFEQEENIK